MTRALRYPRRVICTRRERNRIHKLFYRLPETSTPSSSSSSAVVVDLSFLSRSSRVFTAEIHRLTCGNSRGVVDAQFVGAPRDQIDTSASLDGAFRALVARRQRRERARRRSLHALVRGVRLGNLTHDVHAATLSNEEGHLVGRGALGKGERD